MWDYASGVEGEACCTSLLRINLFTDQTHLRNSWSPNRASGGFLHRNGREENGYAGSTAKVATEQPRRGDTETPTLNYS
ncbi:unnamed protein product, partial [Iphiclides podalirius]